MINVFNDRVAEEGKTEVVQKGDPDGSLFLINPDVRLCFMHSHVRHKRDVNSRACTILIQYWVVA